jgi:NAD(P)-dependent dehydrogenase (short-subunit alcohol dehydrogenase family)
MKTVLITGISRGIGKALAEKFLSEGWRVVGTSTTGEVSFAHENLLVFKLDLASSESIAECSQIIVDKKLFFDILINNAGVCNDFKDEDMSVSILRKTLEVNLIGTIDFTERVLPIILSGGHIINISSSAGSITNIQGAYMPTYKISKVALNMYTRILSLRLKEKNIIVSSVHPGWVRTDMGGLDADMEPHESAEYIFDFAITQPETGNFWFRGKPFAW